VRRALAAAAAAALLTACAGPSPPAPKAAAVTPPARWRTEVGPTAPLDRAWWSGFGDPVMTALVQRALARNTDIALAVARVREARAEEGVARSQLYPSLSLDIAGQRARTLDALGRPTVDTGAQPVFQASYEVDLFGRVANQVTAARRSAQASQAAADAAALSVAAATASGYITLRGLDARLAVARETLASRGEALRIARSRARVGYTSELELRQAEVEYQATAQIVPQVEQQIARQENALSVLAGDSPRAIARGLALAALRAAPIPDGLPADLLRRRPDIGEAELTLAATDANLAAARAAFLPQLQLTGSAGEVLSVALGDPVGIWSIGGSILAPLFAGGRLTAEAGVAAAQRDQAAFAYRRTVLNAFREVDDNLAAVRRLGEQRRILEAERGSAAEALRHAQNRYQAGYSPYLEQLEAQRALLNVELSLVQVEVDQLNARVALYQAMGGGWTAAEATPARASGGGS
jgi:NodT family efflux transporter outer membrane factor (OMF) lipoprotein